MAEIADLERPRAITLDGGGLRLIHGPIDVMLQADGSDQSVARALAAARTRFQTLLEELVAELPALRAPVNTASPRCRGSVARIMEDAATAFAAHGFVTPMAAVAGAVAEALLETMTTAAPDLTRAAANNGGDIALHLAPGGRYRILLADAAGRTRLGELDLTADDNIGGIATSGRHGRSHSLGIADSVTVLADRASQADVAATLVANRVDLPGHPAILRQPASALSPDSDLGDQRVVTDVGTLGADETAAALDAGHDFARMLCETDQIHGAALFLNGLYRVTGGLNPGTKKSHIPPGVAF